MARVIGKTNVPFSHLSVIHFKMRLFTFIFLFIILPESLSARLPDLIPYRKGNLWGYCDSTKNIVIEPQWEYARAFRFGRAAVRKDCKWGIIDSLGKYVIVPSYYHMQVLGRTRFAADLDDEHCGVIDDSGNVVVPFISPWIIQDSDSVLCLRVDMRMKIYDLNGNLLLKGDYLGWDDGMDGCSKFGVFIVSPMEEKKFLRHQSIKGTVVLDKNENPLFPGYFQWITFVDDSLFQCEVNEDSTCYYNLKGNLVSEPYTVDVRIKDRELRTGDYLPMQNLNTVSEWWYDVDGHPHSRFLGWQDLYGTEYWEEVGPIPGEGMKKWR